MCIAAVARFDLLRGSRYLDLDESLAIANTSRPELNVTDRFQDRFAPATSGRDRSLRCRRLSAPPDVPELKPQVGARPLSLVAVQVAAVVLSVHPNGATTRPSGSRASAAACRQRSAGAAGR
jgi:hypothetical protein